MAAPVSSAVPEKPLGFSSKFCVMHVLPTTKSNFIQFRDETWARFIGFAGKWLPYDCTESDVVTESAVKLCLDFTDREACIAAKPESPNVGYHYACYKRFCDISKVKRKEKSEANKSTSQDDGTDMNEIDEGTVAVGDSNMEDGEPSRKRVLRSSEAHNSKCTRDWRKRHMFPEECVFCRTNHYKKKRQSGIRSLIKLSKCELISGGQLLRAAREKEDAEMLAQIEGEDLVARELQYHHACYKNYTRFLSKPRKPLTSSQAGYADAFETFCQDTIRKRIIKGKEILTLGRLNRIFIRTIKQVNGVDSPYRSWHLKKRLQNTFPQLVFVRAKNRSMSDIVYSECLSPEDFAEDLVDGTAGSSTDDSTDDEEECELNVSQVKVPGTTDNLRMLYNAALIMKTAIFTKPSSSLPWPPTSEDLTAERTKEAIPFQLFNFIAWMIGASIEPDDEDYVVVTDDVERRLLSIAQDIIFLASKGKRPMPKHYAVATAIRHMTGSAQAVGVLNGLGHSISQTTLLEYNTALAQRQISMGDITLPPGIQQGIFTTLVWDNIDFGEETLSGKGTTHSTNGIIIQRPSQLPVEVVATPSVKRTRDRTLHAPPTEIFPFMGYGKKKGPSCVGARVDIDKNIHDTAELQPRSEDMAYNIVKFKFSDIPGWTGFNTFLTTMYPVKSVVGYLPVLNASPTEMDTVQTILIRSLKYADALDQQVVVLVFDQAIYAKAQQIRWRDDLFKKRLVIRLGMFHTKMTYLACMGKRFKDAGLSDILIEAGVIAQGSITGVMNGHHYNRSTRAHKLMHDALRHLQWEAYLDSVSEDEQRKANDVMDRLHSGYSEKLISDVVNSDDFQDLMSSFDSFIKKKSLDSPTFTFWADYVDLIENLLLLTRATRTGDWELHLSLVRRILPWMFAYDRPNYARYLSAYYLEMCDLPVTHPSVYVALADGEFAVQRQEDHGFAQIECDLCIEQTCNRDAKTKGGLIGFTTNHGAVLRWLLTQHECSAITNRCKEMAGKGNHQGRSRKDLDQSRVRRDEKDVEAVINTIRSMVNPFEIEGDELIHLSSGVVASNKIKEDLLQAYEIGTTSFASFCKDRLQVENDAYFEPIKRKKLATFDTSKKTSTTKVKGKTVTLKADRNLLARLVFIAKVRKVDLRHMMTYCLGPLPLPIATEQGTLVKTDKASIMRHLEKSAEPTVVVNSIPEGSVWVIDGMAMLQALRSSAPDTFHLLAQDLLETVVKLATRQNSREVHFVTDTYPRMSIKNAERKRRAATGVQIIRIQADNTNQKRPIQWKKFLSASENKEAFVEYLLHVWQRCPPEAYRNVKVYIAHGELCHALRVENGVVVTEVIPELRCSHEEADTRILLHGKYAQDKLVEADSTQRSHPPAVVIKCQDTDVFIISLGCAHQFTVHLLFHTGRGDKVRTLDITSLQSQLGADMTCALVGFHPFTGCDSVSAFSGKGKVTPYKLMIKHDHYTNTFQELGVSFTPSDDLIARLERFVCHVYGQEKTEAVNNARYDKFRLGTHAEESLPPNRDSLLKHIQRANYQAGIFRRCLEQLPEIPSPSEAGWKVEEVDGTSSLEVDWCSLPPAPDDILELVHCSCKKGKCKRAPREDVQSVSAVTCCSELGMPCTELCKCTGCENPGEIDSEEPVPEPEEDAGSDEEEN